MSELPSYADVDLVKPDLCAHYRSLIEGLKPTLVKQQLEGPVAELKSLLYMEALHELDELVFDTGRGLNGDKRSRVGSLLRKAKDLSPEGTGIEAPLFYQKLDAGYRFTVVKPDNDLEELVHRFADVKNCWIGSRENITDQTRAIANWQLQDVAAGGCILVFGETPSTENSYQTAMQIRSYITHTRDGKPILFIDTIEGGDASWTHVFDWVKDDRGAELVYGIATQMHIARELGIQQVAFAEIEAYKLGTMLGMREKKLFHTDEAAEPERKIGIPSSFNGLTGPYRYKLTDGYKQRVLQLEGLGSLSSEEIANRVTRLQDFLSVGGVPKKPGKRDEVRWYIETLKGLSAAEQSLELYEQLGELEVQYVAEERAEARDRIRPLLDSRIGELLSHQLGYGPFQNAFKKTSIEPTWDLPLGDTSDFQLEFEPLQYESEQIPIEPTLDLFETDPHFSTITKKFGSDVYQPLPKIKSYNHFYEDLYGKHGLSHTTLSDCDPFTQYAPYSLLKKSIQLSFEKEK